MHLKAFLAGLHSLLYLISILTSGSFRLSLSFSSFSLIQHTFPLPDGSALRLTIAEYLTPSLRHVTHVGAAQFENGRWIGGGLRPDRLCESVGIPSNIGADLCVGVGLDALAADAPSFVTTTPKTSTRSLHQQEQQRRVLPGSHAAVHPVAAAAAAEEEASSI